MIRIFGCVNSFNTDLIKLKMKNLVIIFTSLAIIFAACKKDKDDETVTPTPVTSVINKYLASGSYGDDVSYK